jgi:hypothetical protein
MAAHCKTAAALLAHIDYEASPCRLRALTAHDIEAFIRQVGPRFARASLQTVVGPPASVRAVSCLSRRGRGRPRHGDRHASRVSLCDRDDHPVATPPNSDGTFPSILTELSPHFKRPRRMILAVRMEFSAGTAEGEVAMARLLTPSHAAVRTQQLNTLACLTAALRCQPWLSLPCCQTALPLTGLLGLFERYQVQQFCRVLLHHQVELPFRDALGS